MKPPLPPQGVYTPEEAARFARVSPTTIRAAYRNGALRVTYPTRHPVITHEALMAWIEAAPTRDAAKAS